MYEVKSECYTSFEGYQELNPQLKGEYEEYKLITKLDDGLVDFIMGLF